MFLGRRDRRPSIAISVLCRFALGSSRSAIREFPFIPVTQNPMVEQFCPFRKVKFHVTVKFSLWTVYLKGGINCRLLSLAVKYLTRFLVVDRCEICRMFDISLMSFGKGAVGNQFSRQYLEWNIEYAVEVCFNFLFRVNLK